MPRLNKATLSIGGTTIVLRDATIQQNQSPIETTSTTDVYRTYLSGRIGTTITATVFVDSTSATVAGILQGATAYSTAATFSLSDGLAGGETYGGSCVLSSVSHAMTLDDVDVYSIELQVSGSVS